MNDAKSEAEIEAEWLALSPGIRGIIRMLARQAAEDHLAEQAAPDPTNPIPPMWQTEIAHPREIEGRGLCGIQRFITTDALMVGLTFDGGFYNYTARYCYPDRREARKALEVWDGQGDPPGDWVKEKVSERLGPGVLK